MKVQRHCRRRAMMIALKKSPTDSHILEKQFIGVKLQGSADMNAWCRLDLGVV